MICFGFMYMSREPRVPTIGRQAPGQDIYYKLKIYRGKTRTYPRHFSRKTCGKKPCARNAGLFSHFRKLAGNSFNGAGACAGTAVNTDISVDFALAFSISGNSAQGAGFFTNAATDAQILVDGMSHNDTST